MSSRFRPSARLRSRVEFVEVQQRGRRVAARFMTLVGRPNAFDRDRLGIIASRRLGGAVVRNRAKRRVREAFRRWAGADTDAGCRLDLVVIPRRELLEAPRTALDDDFRSALRRLRRTKWGTE